MSYEKRITTQKLDNKEHLDAASAKSVVMKGFDGSSYPAISVDSSGNVNVNASSSGFGPTEDLDIDYSEIGGVKTYVITGDTLTKTVTIQASGDITIRWT